MSDTAEKEAPKQVAKEKVMSHFLWVIDPGHGGREQTPGKRSPKWGDGSQYFEGEGNRSIAWKVSDKLHRAGIRHVFTVESTDLTDVPLPKRTEWINQIQGPKIVVSIHSDGVEDTRAHGHSVYTSVGETDSDKVATIFHDFAKNAFPNEKFRMDTKDGDPDKEEPFWILKHTNCPAVLLENFFHTNERQCKEILMTLEGKEKIATYIVDAIKHIEANHSIMGL